MNPASTQARVDPGEFSARARAFVALHRSIPTQRLIRNVGATVDALDVDGLTLPATINSADHGDAWICSPITTYVDYASEELRRLDKPALSKALRPAIAAAGAALRAARLDACVAINNWLVSTNVYPDADAATIARVVDAARARWPDQALWFRSLNHAHSPIWLGTLRALGASLVPTRQVYLYDDIDALENRHADMRKDLQRLHGSDMRPLLPGALDESGYARAAALYAMLYLGKYSRLNPEYTAELLKRWHQAGLLSLHGTCGADGQLQGVVGMLRFGNVITSPIVGYDTGRPQREGLYRLLAATVFDQARQQRCLVNLSAGVAHFKRQRGGVPAIEYSAVIADHLPTRTRAAIGALGVLTRRIGVPIMQRYRL